MLFSIFAMIVGVALFGDFIGCLSENSTDNSVEPELTEKLDQLSEIRSKYNITGKSVVDMDYILSKLKDKRYINECKLIEKLPHE